MSMFDNLKNLKQLAGMMGNLGDIRERIEQAQAELGKKSVEADSGAGAVRVVMNGKFEVVSVRIDPAMIVALAGGGTDTDREMVEELVAAAVNAATVKVQELIKETVGEHAMGMGLPGLG